MIGETIEESKEINWLDFDSEYVKIEENEPVDLVLTEWRQVTKEYEGKESEAIRFTVLEENGEEVKKTLDASGKRLPQALKPLILATEKAGGKRFKCRITRVGTGKSTSYGVKQL